MPGKSKISTEVQLNIVQDYEVMRSSEVAKKYKINRKTVLKIVARHGGTVKPHRLASGIAPMPVDDFLELATELRECGWSQKKIGDKLGVSQAVVSRIFVKAGLNSKWVQQGANNPLWKGGTTLTDAGYVLEKVYAESPFYPMTNKMGYVPQHRLVMAKHLGRCIHKGETVHHINGDRSDNRIENLQLRAKAHGKGVVLKCACCGSNNIITEHI